MPAAASELRTFGVVPALFFLLVALLVLALAGGIAYQTLQQQLDEKMAPHVADGEAASHSLESARLSADQLLERTRAISSLPSRSTHDLVNEALASSHRGQHT